MFLVFFFFYLNPYCRVIHSGPLLLQFWNLFWVPQLSINTMLNCWSPSFRTKHHLQTRTEQYSTVVTLLITIWGHISCWLHQLVLLLLPSLSSVQRFWLHRTVQSLGSGISNYRTQSTSTHCTVHTSRSSLCHCTCESLSSHWLHSWCKTSSRSELDLNPSYNPKVAS